MKLNVQHIFLVLASFILLAPALFFFADTNKSKEGETENRATILYNPKKPFEKMDEDYKYNFGFRRILSEKYIDFKKKIFHTSPIPDKVIYGLDGWLFLGNSYNEVYAKSVGTKTFSEQDVQNIADKINEMNKFCESNGVKFYYFVAPNSHTIYADKLPLKVLHNTKDFELIKHKLHNKYELLDIKPALLAEKKHRRIYQKTDSHWNEYGAYIAVNELLKTMRKDLPKIELLKLKNYHLKKTYSQITDLAVMLKSKIAEELVHFQAKKKLRIQENTQLVKVISEIHIKQQKSAYKGIVYRDSYADMMIPFLNQSFGEMIYFSSPRFDKQRILDEKPDFVIYEIVERNLNFTEL